MNIWDILILVLIAAVVVFAIREILSRKKRGGSDSCIGCPGCTKARAKECSHSPSGK